MSCSTTALSIAICAILFVNNVKSVEFNPQCIPKDFNGTGNKEIDYIFVLDSSLPREKLDKIRYVMKAISCEIPKGSKYRLKTITVNSATVKSSSFQNSADFPNTVHEVMPNETDPNSLVCHRLLQALDTIPNFKTADNVYVILPFDADEGCHPHDLFDSSHTIPGHHLALINMDGAPASNRATDLSLKWNQIDINRESLHKSRNFTSLQQSGELLEPIAKWVQKTLDGTLTQMKKTIPSDIFPKRENESILTTSETSGTTEPGPTESPTTETTTIWTTQEDKSMSARIQEESSSTSIPLLAKSDSTSSTTSEPHSTKSSEAITSTEGSGLSSSTKEVTTTEDTETSTVTIWTTQEDKSFSARIQEESSSTSIPLLAKSDSTSSTTSEPHSTKSSEAITSTEGSGLSSSTKEVTTTEDTETSTVTRIDTSTETTVTQPTTDAETSTRIDTTTLISASENSTDNKGLFIPAAGNIPVSEESKENFTSTESQSTLETSTTGDAGSGSLVQHGPINDNQGTTETTVTEEEKEAWYENYLVLIGLVTVILIIILIIVVVCLCCCRKKKGKYHLVEEATQRTPSPKNSSKPSGISYSPLPDENGYEVVNQSESFFNSQAQTEPKESNSSQESTQKSSAMNKGNSDEENKMSSARTASAPRSYAAPPPPPPRAPEGVMDPYNDAPTNPYFANFKPIALSPIGENSKSEQSQMQKAPVVQPSGILKKFDIGSSVDEMF